MRVGFKKMGKHTHYITGELLRKHILYTLQEARCHTKSTDVMLLGFKRNYLGVRSDPLT